MKFLRKCPVAIDPLAWGAHGIDYRFDEGPQQEAEEFTSDIAYISIRGPLSHHDEWFFESYDGIIERARKAFASSAKVVFISGDTPGGDVSGMLDTARELRQLADDSGKLLVWYVDGQTCSAGVVLAMAADYIVIPEEARFGSIGIIAELTSYKKQAESYGAKTVLVTSGERKADGHPMNDISDETIEAVQKSVDYEAELFFSWVSERREIPVETIRGWQAGIFHGQEAIDVGLADELGGEAAALAMVAGVDLTEAPEGAENEEAMNRKTLAASARAALGLPEPKAVASSAEGEDLESIKKRLGKKAAEDSEEGRRARKALDALDDKEEKEEKTDDTDDSAEDDTDDSAEDDTDDSAEDDTDDSAEDDTEDDKSESEDVSDAKSAARKAEADAEDDEAKARAALASNAKGSVKNAKALLASAARKRSQAKALRAQAARSLEITALKKTVVSLAKSLDRVNAEIKKGSGMPRNAAVAGQSARGTPTGQGKPKSKVAAMTPEYRKAFGIGDSHTAISGHDEGGRFFINPAGSKEAAAARLAELDAEVKALGNVS